MCACVQCHDDFFWMMATVAAENKDGDAQTRMVTNDRMRDHWHKLLGKRPFLRWSSSQIIRCVRLSSRGGGCPAISFSSALSFDIRYGDDGTPAVALEPPAQFSREMQRAVAADGEVVWHLPSADDEADWLVLRIPPANEFET